jgi:hypothetical protein
VKPAARPKPLGTRILASTLAVSLLAMHIPFPVLARPTATPRDGAPSCGSRDCERACARVQPEEAGPSAPSPAQSREDSRGGDPCCPNGCKHCSLPCCDGMPAAVLSYSITVAQVPVFHATGPPGTPLSPIEPEEVFHPPRS